MHIVDDASSTTGVFATNETQADHGPSPHGSLPHLQIFETEVCFFRAFRHLTDLFIPMSGGSYGAHFQQMVSDWPCAD